MCSSLFRENLPCLPVNFSTGVYDFIERPVIDKVRTRIGTVRDFRTTTNNGEFPTILIELEPNVKKSHSLERIYGVRVRTDYIEEVGTEVRLSKDVNELSREWNEITVHK